VDELFDLHYGPTARLFPLGYNFTTRYGGNLPGSISVGHSDLDSFKAAASFKTGAPDRGHKARGLCEPNAAKEGGGQR